LCREHSLEVYEAIQIVLVHDARHVLPPQIVLALVLFAKALGFLSVWRDEELLEHRA
jgi:hypothetical protein